MFNLKPNPALWQVTVMNLRSIKEIVFFAALLLVSVAVFVPFSPSMPWEGLDPSWVYGMNEAVAQGMSFGEDIIFTSGPYCSIYTKTYHPATDHLMIWGSLFLAILFAIVAYLNFRTTSLPLMVGLLVVLSTVMYSPDALFFFYPMLVGVQVYNWTNSIDSQRRAGIAKIALNIALFASFGLLPLIKGSVLIACAAITVLSIALLAMRGKWILCAMIAATPLVSLVFFWLISGQPLHGLDNYFTGLQPIISGYTEAMAINGDSREYLLYSFAASAIVIIVFLDARRSAYDKLVVTLIFISILFLAFKAGFVRHDGHALTSGTMILFSALLAGTLVDTREHFALLLASLVAWIYIDAAYMKTSTYNIKENFENSFASGWAGLKQRIKDREALTRSFESRVAELNKRSGIPRLNGSADIYSYDQSYLIASGNTWNPRPIFQSYSAYTAYLAELNKKHLVSETRPDYIIFKVQPIDGRLPSLEDGASWPVLLSNYEPISFSNGYLYLKTREGCGNVFEKPTKIGAGFYSLGEQIILPNSASPLFVKVGIRKSLLGAILNTLFKPSRLVIKVTMQNGVTREYRIVAGMSESGFLISPLIESTEELGLLFSDANFLDDKTVKSIEIVAPRFSMLWKKSFEIGFYQLNPKSSSGFLEKMDFVIPRQGDFMKVSSAQRCDGSIDFVNGVSPAPQSIRATALLHICGWLAASVDLTEVPDKVYLVLSNSQGERYFIDTKRTQRPDVGTHFNKPGLNLSGYETTANVSNLVGQYHLKLAYLKGNELFICPQFNIQVKLNQD